jgi:2-aminoethylphosphonate-pyruvate transaminase
MTEKRLFTPGPLNTSRTVKEAMLRDVGSRDADFVALVRQIRARLLALAGVSQASGYEAILIQGSGTFGVESVISSVLPPPSKLLVLTNGAYGDRIAQIAVRHGIAHEFLRFPESEPLNAEALNTKLSSDPALTHVAAVHCETSTGILNPIESLSRVVQQHKRTFIVDAMSSFGAIPINLAQTAIDFLISSANKCIQGVPGFSFVLARRDKLELAKTCARTISLDLYEQWRGLEANGQFRFTPPTHALLAFAQALDELDREGGVAARGRRYTSNHNQLIAGLKKVGFVPFLDPSFQSIIITAVHYPAHPNFRFDDFYRRLSEHGMVIYPGKLTGAECFRLGNIGDLYREDIDALLHAIAAVLSEMDIHLPLPPPTGASPRA